MIRLSLIITTYNRAAQLLVALESVVRQTLPADRWECIVVNNNSTDDTEERFAAFAAGCPVCNLRLVRETKPGVSAARNRGLSEARGEILALIDDDEHVNPEFMESYLGFFDAHPGALVAGGRIVAEYPSGRPEWMSTYVEIAIANPMDYGPAVRPFPAGKIPGGGNMAFRREALERYGAFDPALGRVGDRLLGGEETDFFRRLVCGGETLWYVPGAVIWHVIPPAKLTAEYFRRLCFNIGVSQRMQARDRGRMGGAVAAELLKWGATCALCLTMSPRKARWLVRMRREISRGLFARERQA